MLDIVARVFSLMTIPIIAIMVIMMIRSIKKEQAARVRTNIIGIILAPLSLLVNVIFFNKALPDSISALVLLIFIAIFGLGFGLAWGQTAKLYQKGEKWVVKRSALHLIFWLFSYSLTQFLAAFATTIFVSAGLAALLFSVGTTLGTNSNMLFRQLRLVN